MLGFAPLSSAPLSTTGETNSAFIFLEDATLAASGTVHPAGTLSATLEDASSEAIATFAPSGVADETFATITAVTGIYADDTDVVIGDHGFGYTIAGTFSTVDLTNGALASSAGGTFRYWTYDVSANEWLGPADEVYPGVTGTLSVTLEDATLSASGTYTAPVIGSLNVTLEDATLDASGTYFDGVSGTINVTLEDATSTASGLFYVPVTGSLSETLDDATLSASGSVASDVTGTASITLDDATLTATATYTGLIWTIQTDNRSTWTEQSDSSDTWTIH